MFSVEEQEQEIEKGMMTRRDEMRREITRGACIVGCKPKTAITKKAGGRIIQTSISLTYNTDGTKT